MKRQRAKEARELGRRVPVAPGGGGGRDRAVLLKVPITTRKRSGAA